MLKKGDVFQHKSTKYTIVDKVSRTYILEDEQQKQFKATESTILKHMTKIKDGYEVFEKKKYPFLEKRLEYNKILKYADKLPTNAIECEPWFQQLEAEYSPENLTCDGELSHTQIRLKEKEILGAWKELEKIAGKKREMVY